jgi:hypothetical protein
MQQDVVIKVTAHQLIDLSAVPCGTHDGLQAPLVWAGTTVPWQRGGGCTHNAKQLQVPTR